MSPVPPTSNEARPQYAWATYPTVFRKEAVDPNVVRAELDRIRAAHGGAHNIPAIIEEARVATNPLHPLYPWDSPTLEKIALEKITGDIIRCLLVIVITPERREIPIRAFVSMPAGARTREYVPFEEVGDYRTGLIRSSRSAQRRWRSQYLDLMPPKLKALYEAFYEGLEALDLVEGSEDPSAPPSSPSLLGLGDPSAHPAEGAPGQL